MDIERFDLERWQSIYEHDVEINLSESGVHPLRVGDIVETADLDDLLGQDLGYTQTNGTVTLRERVAALYDGASAANVVVTNGGSEANFVTCWHLIEPGDEVVVVQPTYMQIPGLARSFGATVRDERGKPIGRDAWDFQDVEAFVAVARRQRVRRTVPPTTKPGIPCTTKQLLLFETA